MERTHLRCDFLNGLASDADWVSVGTGVPSGGSTTTNVEVSPGTDAAFY